MFQILALDKTDFSHLDGLGDEALANLGVVPMVADAYPAYPCRVSLDFAPVGERVFLLNYAHHKTETPFRSNYAIYVREGVRTLELEPGDLPPVFRRRSPIAVRAFDKTGMLRSAEIVEGPDAGEVFDRLLDQDHIAYLHAHYAAYGCYAAEVLRAA